MAHRLSLTALALLAMGCGSSSPSPLAPAPSTASAVVAVRITGVPAALSPGQTVQLSAEVVLASGATKDCSPTAAWSVDQPAVVSVSSTGLLTGRITGYANVEAVCGGTRGTKETKVSAVSPYRLLILPYDSEVPSEFGVATTVEFLDGPQAGQTVTAGSIFTNGVGDVVWPVKVRLTAEMYAPKEVVLAEATGKRRNPQSNLFDFSIPMTFAGAPSTDTFVRRMTRDESQTTHPFTLGAPGSVRVRTWWSVDYNDRLSIELWCGGARQQAITQLFGSAGGGFTKDVAAAGACEVRLRQLKTDAYTHYRLAITYPH